MGGSGSVPEDGHSSELRNRLLEQCQPFAAQARLVEKYPCDVPARPGEAGGEPGRDRITFKVDGYDRKGSGHTLHGLDGARSTRDNHVNAALHQFGREGREAFLPFVRPAVLDGEVLTLDVAEFCQALPQCLEDVRHPTSRSETRIEDANLCHLSRLRPGERRGEETARNERDEGSALERVAGAGSEISRLHG